MKRLASWSRFPWRTAGWILSSAAATVVVATLMAASGPGNETDRGGASPYSPTRGEWLCVVLNSRQALFNSERVSNAVAVRYLYDLSRPDTVRIEVLTIDGASEEQLQRRAAQAKNEATEAAKVYGWQNWLKVELDERKVTDRLSEGALIR
jgi:hypothetical protein